MKLLFHQICYNHKEPETYRKCEVANMDIASTNLELDFHPEWPVMRLDCIISPCVRFPGISPTISSNLGPHYLISVCAK